MPSTIVLVHGAWHGAWCFEKIIPLLEAKGHRVFAPDLPGHGVHRKGHQVVTLEDYVTAIATLVKAIDEPVILVGHSMGGIIISQVAEWVPDRIKELVYLAAYVPSHGESLLSIAERATLTNMSAYLTFDTEQQEIVLDKSGAVQNVLAPLASHDAQMVVVERLQSQPLLPFIETVNLGEAFASVRKKAIICKHDKAIASSDQIKMAEKVGARILLISADHAPFFSNPEDCILAITSGD